jgi:hypothetical protein
MLLCMLAIRLEARLGDGAENPSGRWKETTKKIERQTQHRRHPAPMCAPPGVTSHHVHHVCTTSNRGRLYRK